MLKYAHRFGISWGVVFLITFFTAKNLDMGHRVLYTFVAAVVATSLLSFSGRNNGEKTDSKRNTANSKPQLADKKANTIYIFRGMESQFLYRYDGKYVYEGLNNRFLYRIEGNKIYEGFNPTFSYRMEGNKIYRGFETKPLYHIIGNEIYSGNFGNTPVFRIRNTIRPW